MKLRRKLILGAALFLSIAGAAVAFGTRPALRYYLKSMPIYQKAIEEPLEDRVSKEGFVETIGDEENKIDVLYAKGTGYEIGVQHGKLLKKKVRKNIRGVLRECYKFIEKQSGIPRAGKMSAEEILDEAYRAMESSIPKEYKDEMRGLADSSGISIEDIHRVNAIPEITETSCSGIAALGRATKDGNLYQVRILDYIMELGIQDRPLITVCKPDNGNAYVNIGWAGFVGVISGMNEKGIAVSEMGYGGPGNNMPGIPKPEPAETLRGMPMPFLLKKVLQYSDNVEQANGIIRSADGTNYYVFIIGDGITNGLPEARGYIKTSSSCIIYLPNDPCYPIDRLEDVVYGSHYNTRCHELLKKHFGQLTPKILMRDIIPAISMKKNLQCVVYDPKEMKFWVANAKGTDGKACDQKYTMFDFGQAVKR